MPDNELENLMAKVPEKLSCGGSRGDLHLRQHVECSRKMERCRSLFFPHKGRLGSEIPD